MSNFDETLQVDQVEGAEFKFLGLEDRFEKSKRSKFLNVEIEISNFRARIKIPARLSFITSSKKYAARFLENLTVGYPAKRKLSRAKIDSYSSIFVQNRSRRALFSTRKTHFSSTLTKEGFLPRWWVPLTTSPTFVELCANL